MIGIFIFVLNNIKKELFMSEENRFEKRYIEGNLPWDVKRRDFNLSELVEDGTISAGKVLELGCGTGDNAIWLAKNGFYGRLVVLKNGRDDDVPLEVVTNSKKIINLDKYYNIQRLRPHYHRFEMKPLFLMAADS